MSEDILQLQFARNEILPSFQREDVVVERESNHRHVGVFEQSHDGWRHSRHIESEQEADFVGGNLQERHLIEPSAPKRRSRLGVDAEKGLRQQEIDGSLGLAFTENDNDATAKLRNGQFGNLLLGKPIV